MWQREMLTDNSHLQPKDPDAYYAKLDARLARRREKYKEQARCLCMILTDEDWDYLKRAEDLRREKERLDWREKEHRVYGSASKG